MPKLSSPSFMNGKFRVQKYAIIEYLNMDFEDMAKTRARELYDLPKTDSREELYDIEYAMKKPNYVKDIFDNKITAKRFIKELEDNFANNGSDSFSYTCRACSEQGVFHYPEDDGDKYITKRRNDLLATFGAVLDKWAENYADQFVTYYDGVHELYIQDQKNRELLELERLAKKHGKTLK